MKVVVYAICKNEEKNVELWYNSMQEADEIYCLDTGSTDKTIELLSKYPKVTVKQEIIEPFRFDEARNKSLEMVPEDADICLCTDIDERFAPGWRKKIEEVWIPGKTNKGKYMYYWSVNDDLTPGSFFYLSKMHSRHGHKWQHQVHEVLMSEVPIDEVMIDIILYHYPDATKSRGQYLGILERAVKENPNDSRDVYCLGREYKHYNRYEDTIKVFHHFLKLEGATWNQERATAMRMIGDSYLHLSYFEEAILWFNYAIQEVPHVREVYYDLGRAYIAINDFENARTNLNKAIKIKDKNTEYLNEDYVWDGSIYDYAACAEYNTGHYKQAYIYAKEAAKAFPNDERIKGNLITMEKVYKDNLKKTTK